MYVRPSAPRPVGGVLDDAVSLYRNVYPKLVPLTVGAAVISAIPGIFIAFQMSAARAGGTAALVNLFMSPAYWRVALLTLVLQLSIYGALLAALESFVSRGDISLGESIGTGLRVLPRMLVVTMLFFFIFSLGLLLFVVPGIYLYGIFQLSWVALIVERCGIFDAFGTSRRLISGHWWRTVIIVSIAVIIVFVFGLIGGFVNGALTAVFGFGSTVALLSQTLIGLAVNVFLLPLLPCFLLATYHDLKLRHDGGDLAARVDALVAH